MRREEGVRIFQCIDCRYCEFYIGHGWLCTRSMQPVHPLSDACEEAELHEQRADYTVYKRLLGELEEYKQMLREGRHTRTVLNPY